MEQVRCNLCEDDNAKALITTSDLTYGTPGQFTIVRCRNCGLAYLNPRPDASEIGAFYPPNYGEHVASASPNPFALAEAAMVHRRCRRPGRILEIGCAAGYFLGAMRELGWEVAGVEPDPEAARKAASVDGATVKTGILQQGDFENSSFDAVALWSVLEHLHNPLDTMKIISGLLKPDGHLFFGIPNFGSLERKVFGSRWFGLDVPRHLYHFTPSTVRKLLSAAGLEPVEIMHASGHDTFKFSASRRLRDSYGRSSDTGRLSGEAAATTATKGRAWRRFLNGACVGLFTRAADVLHRGSQMLVTARKRSTQ
jgi:2-polyprenyl-3-methyl-5-hydroxy-6-metoxy-1,4-benzoquinol methylase